MNRNFKKLTFFLFYLFLVKGVYSQVIPTEKIVIKKVSVLITTPFNISCEDFERSFNSDQISERVITDSMKLKQFNSMVNNITYDINDLQSDIRFKFYFYFSEKLSPTVLCMDRFNRIFFNGKMIKKNKKMIRFLNEISKE